MTVRQTGDGSPRLVTVVSSRYVSDRASSSALIRMFVARNIVTLLSPVYLCCLGVVATSHELSPLLATCHGSGVLAVVVFFSWLVQLVGHFFSLSVAMSRLSTSS